MSEKFQVMLYDPPLRVKGKKDYHPKETIEDSIRGVEYDFYYTGKRRGTGKQIELHVTSIIRDWEENVFIRKAWYGGNRSTWKDCIREHVRKHLEDLNVGQLLTRRLMQDFEIRDEHFKKWEEYNPVEFRGFN